MSETRNPLICPNCGAPTSNHLNCEYCGSMLVRFTKNDIDILSTHYVKADNLFAGVAEEIQTNFKYQKQNPKKNIVTSIFFKKDFGDILKAFPIRDTGLFRQYYTHIPTIERSINIIDENRIAIFPDAHKNALALRVSIYDCWRESKLFERFTKLKQYPLFEKRHVENGDDPAGSVFSVGRYDYFIDFGTDVKGAAILYSEILRDVYLLDESDDLFFKTQVIEAPELQPSPFMPLIPWCTDMFSVILFPLFLSLFNFEADTIDFFLSLFFLSFSLVFYGYNLFQFIQIPQKRTKLEIFHYSLSIIMVIIGVITLHVEFVCLYFLFLCGYLFYKMVILR